MTQVVESYYEEADMSVQIFKDARFCHKWE